MFCQLQNGVRVAVMFRSCKAVLHRILVFKDNALLFLFACFVSLRYFSLYLLVK
jgi:hypothetical protein